eukprot:6191301-Pleurochrysis_carterae.AAC.2
MHSVHSEDDSNMGEPPSAHSSLPSADALRHPPASTNQPVPVNAACRPLLTAKQHHAATPTGFHGDGQGDRPITRLSRCSGAQRGDEKGGGVKVEKKRKRKSASARLRHSAAAARAA